MKPPQTQDEYLARLPADQREALEALRRTIRSAAPEAEEGISTRVPAFRYKGRYLASFGAAKTHVSLFVMQGAVLTDLKAELGAFDSTRTTVRFTPDRPLPKALVKKIIARRMQEIDAKVGPET